jgi:hypothetical protein
MYPIIAPVEPHTSEYNKRFKIIGNGISSDLLRAASIASCHKYPIEPNMKKKRKNMYWL